MNNGCKISLKYVSTLILTLLFFCITVNSSARYYRNPWLDSLPKIQDTIPIKNFNGPRDTVIQDSAVLDTLPFHSDSVQAADRYHCIFLFPRIRWMRPLPIVHRIPWCSICLPRISPYTIRQLPSIRILIWRLIISGWISPTVCSWPLIPGIHQAK